MFSAVLDDVEPKIGSLPAKVEIKVREVQDEGGGLLRTDGGNFVPGPQVGTRAIRAQLLLQLMEPDGLRTARVASESDMVSYTRCNPAGCVDYLNVAVLGAEPERTRPDDQ